MLVSEAVGAALADLGTDTVFGVVGSGNFHVTNALIARGARYIAAHCAGLTVRSLADLGPVRSWLSGPRDRPPLIDAKITSAHGSWWLEEAFRGH